MIVKLINGIIERWFILAIGCFIAGMSCIPVFTDLKNGQDYKMPEGISDADFRKEYNNQIINIVETSSGSDSFSSIKKDARDLAAFKLGAKRVKKEKSIYYLLIPVYIAFASLCVAFFASAFEIYSGWDREYQKEKQKRKAIKEKQDQEKHELDLRHKQEKHDAKMKMLDPYYDPVYNKKND